MYACLGLKFVHFFLRLLFCAHCTVEKLVFCNFIYHHFVICRSGKEYVHGEVHEEMLMQTFSVFEPEQCLQIGNYKYSFDRNFIILWQMELVRLFYLFFFFWYILFILSFGCATIVNREMKSVSAI